MDNASTQTQSIGSLTVRLAAQRAILSTQLALIAKLAGGNAALLTNLRDTILANAAKWDILESSICDYKNEVDEVFSVAIKAAPTAK